VVDEEPVRRKVVDVVLEEVTVSGDEAKVGELASQVRGEEKKRSNRGTGAILAKDHRQDSSGGLDGEVRETSLTKLRPTRLEADAGREKSTG